MDPVRQLGLTLVAEGYDEDGLRRVAVGLDDRQAEVLRRHGVLPGGRLAELVDRYRHGLPVGDDGPAELAGARITPWLGVLTAHDPDDPAALGPEHVPGANSSAAGLALATVRLPVESALDLGTGCGIHALLAARHAERVVATDLNPRALRYTALNARLNGLENIETREGSWLEPVAGERFDLVVCNPPYVLSPEREFLFRDGGDGLVERLVRDIPGHLTDGGFACVAVGWATRPGESPWAQLEAWVEGTACDALAVALGSEGALPYAARWVDPLGGLDGAQYATRVERWLAFLREAGADTVWHGLLVLRRREGTTWFRGIGAPEPIEGWAGDHVLRLVAAQDWLASSPGPVLEQRLRLVAGHRLVSEATYGPKGYGTAHVALSPGEGLGIRAAVDPEVLRILVRLDGTRTLDELVTEPLAAPVAAGALHLLELGIVEPVP